MFNSTQRDLGIIPDSDPLCLLMAGNRDLNERGYGSDESGSLTTGAAAPVNLRRHPRRGQLRGTPRAGPQTNNGLDRAWRMCRVSEANCWAAGHSRGTGNRRRVGTNGAKKWCSQYSSAAHLRANNSSVVGVWRAFPSGWVRERRRPRLRSITARYPRTHARIVPCDAGLPRITWRSTTS